MLGEDALGVGKSGGVAEFIPRGISIMVACTLQLHSMNLSLSGLGTKGGDCQTEWLPGKQAGMWRELGKGVGTGTDKTTRRSGEMKWVNIENCFSFSRQRHVKNRWNAKIFDNRTECWAHSPYVCVCVCAVWECVFVGAECLFFSPSINNAGNCCHKCGKSRRSCHNNLTQLKRNEHMLHAPFDCLRLWPGPWRAASAILAISTVAAFGFVYETHTHTQWGTHTHTAAFRRATLLFLAAANPSRVSRSH